MANEAKAGWREKARSELLKGLITAACSALAGMLALVYAPFGDDIQERLDPTSVIVRGQITRGQIPVRDVVVILDTEDQDPTGGQGLFWFEEVGKGRHEIAVMEGGNLALSEEFVVPQGIQEYPISTIDLAAVPLFPLAAEGLGNDPHPAFKPEPRPRPVSAPVPAEEATEASAPEPASSPMAGRDEEPSLEPTATVSFSFQPAPIFPRDVIGGEQPVPADPGPALPRLDSGDSLTLTIETREVSEDEVRPGMADGASMAEARVFAPDAYAFEIDHVTYYLDPSFNPSVVTRYSADDDFLLSFITPGPFPLAAKVYLSDGTVIDLTQQVDSQDSGR